MKQLYLLPIYFTLFTPLLFSMLHEPNPAILPPITEEEAVEVIKKTLQEIDFEKVSYLAYLTTNKLADYFDRHQKMIKFALIKYFCHNLLPYFSPTRGIMPHPNKEEIVAQATNKVIVQCYKQQNNLFDVTLRSAENNNIICSMPNYPRPISGINFLLEYKNNDNQKRNNFPFVCIIEEKINDGTPPSLVVWHKRMGTICAEIPLPHDYPTCSFFLQRQNYEDHRGKIAHYNLIYPHKLSSHQQNYDFICFECLEIDYSSLTIQQLLLIAKLFFGKKIESSDHYYVEGKNHTFFQSHSNITTPLIDDPYWLLAYNRLPETLKLFYESIIIREKMLNPPPLETYKSSIGTLNRRLPPSLDLKSSSEGSATRTSSRSILKRRNTYGSIPIDNIISSHNEVTLPNQTKATNPKLKNIPSLDNIFKPQRSNTF